MSWGLTKSLSLSCTAASTVCFTHASTRWLYSGQPGSAAQSRNLATRLHNTMGALVFATYVFGS